METGRCVSEIKANIRQMLVINQYQKYKHQTLPQDKEYWTLSNVQGRTDTHEFGQMINQKFLNPNQFNGVDNDISIINENKKNIPEANWHHGNFSSIIQKQLKYDNINPGLLYYDTTEEISVYTIETFLQILLAIYLKGNDNCFAIYNFIVKNPYSGKIFNDDEIAKFLATSRMWKSIKETKWVDHGYIIRYESGPTKMGSIYFSL